MNETFIHCQILYVVKEKTFHKASSPGMPNVLVRAAPYWERRLPAAVVGSTADDIQCRSEVVESNVRKIFGKLPKKGQVATAIRPVGGLEGLVPPSTLSS